MGEALKIKTLISILILGILFSCLNSMPLVSAQPTPTLLILAVHSPPIGTPFWSECTMEATLKDENGNPLANMDIVFSECASELIGTAKTDSNGVASLTYMFPEARMYPLLANFSGTTTYAPSGSEYVRITIIDYTPHLVGGGLIAVAIIGVVGYIFFSRRKKAITVPITTKKEKNMRINLLQIRFSK